jgi:hypothetical protein
MTKYDVTLLQSSTGTKLVELILELRKEMRMWKDEYLKMIDASDPYIVEDTTFIELNKKVNMLKKDHHNALNSLTGFKGKIHSEQLKYMRSEKRRDRYKTSN